MCEHTTDSPKHDLFLQALLHAAGLPDWTTNFHACKRRVRVQAAHCICTYHRASLLAKSFVLMNPCAIIFLYCVYPGNFLFACPFEMDL